MLELDIVKIIVQSQHHIKIVIPRKLKYLEVIGIYQVKMFDMYG